MFLHDIRHFSAAWNPNIFMYPAGVTVLCDKQNQQTADIQVEGLIIFVPVSGRLSDRRCPNTSRSRAPWVMFYIYFTVRIQQLHAETCRRSLSDLDWFCASRNVQIKYLSKCIYFHLTSEPPHCGMLPPPYITVGMIFAGDARCCKGVWSSVSGVKSQVLIMETAVTDLRGLDNEARCSNYCLVVQQKEHQLETRSLELLHLHHVSFS